MIVAGAVAAILIFGFFINLERQEKKLMKRFDSSLDSIQDFLDTVSRKEYTDRKNFPAGLLEGGRTEIENSYEAINELNQLDLKKKNLGKKLTANLWPLKNGGELKLEKILADLKSVEKEISWWLYFQEGIKDILVYDPAIDLKNRSAQEEKRDFIFRLYFAKAGLLKAGGHLEEASLASGDKNRLNQLAVQIESIIETIDSLIIAADKNKLGESDRLRQRYIIQAGELKKDAAAAAAQAYTESRFPSLALKLNQLISDLPDARKQ